MYDNVMVRSFLYLVFVLCFTLTSFAQKVNKFDPKELETEWRLKKNMYQDKSQFLASLTFVNHSTQTLSPTGWKIYFSLRYHGYALSSKNPALEIKHVSGDLFCIQPSQNFTGLPRSESIVMEFVGNGRIANYQDVPSGLFFVSDDDVQHAVDLIPPVIYKMTGDAAYDQLPSLNVAGLYDHNKLIKDIPESQLTKVLPTPKRYRPLNESFILDGSVNLVADKSFSSEADYLANELQKVLGVKLGINDLEKKGRKIVLKKYNFPSEAYRLKSTKDQITIEANDGAGIFYGIQSLKSLLPVTSWSSKQQVIPVPGVEIEDAPRFGFRAFMLDVARNFRAKEEILKVLEVMSLYKLNVFHFHFNDDEGWRLEIPGLPELTEIGAQRGYPFASGEQLHPSYGSGINGNVNSGSGFYTRADYIEIVKYAAERHIKVIPEIESPGHARAAIKAMETRYGKYIKLGNTEEAERYLLHDRQDKSVYLSNQGFRDNVMNVAFPSSYRFIEKVIDEIRKMHEEAGAPLTIIHMAGDEVPHGSWEGSPVAQALVDNDLAIQSSKDLWRYYFNKVKKILSERGLSFYGWQELVVGAQTADNSAHTIHTDYLKDDLLLDAWWNQYGNEDIPYKLANMGYRTILTCFDFFYFDLSYANDFSEPGDGWVGFLDVEKIYSFIPYDYYRNAKTDMRGEMRPSNFFAGKEKLTEKGKKKIEGIQGALWGENLIAGSLMEYHLLPKLLAVAEKAWAEETKWEKETDSLQSQKLFQEPLTDFINRLAKRELPRLDYYNGGYDYRIPSPGVKLQDGKAVANVLFPGFAIRYTVDGSEPTSKSSLYTQPIADITLIKLKVFDQRGRGGLSFSVMNK